jgi:hypothetical protein
MARKVDDLVWQEFCRRYNERCRRREIGDLLLGASLVAAVVLAFGTLCWSFYGLGA